jgi:hypothetical protein
VFLEFCRLLNGAMPLKGKMQSFEESTLLEDLDDVVKFNQIKEMIKSEFI